VLVGSIAAMGPLVLVYLLVCGPVGVVALALVGVSVIGTFGVSMVMSQEYLPRNIGLASGLTIGLAIGVGGVAAVGLGALADMLELRTALFVCAAVPLLSLVLGTRLPSSRAAGPLAPEPVVP
jgi:MFS transporter, FSR family, fosmidomycin resistance protein